MFEFGELVFRFSFGLCEILFAALSLRGGKSNSYQKHENSLFILPNMYGEMFLFINYKARIMIRLELLEGYVLRCKNSYWQRYPKQQCSIKRPIEIVASHHASKWIALRLLTHLYLHSIKSRYRLCLCGIFKRRAKDERLAKGDKVFSMCETHSM